MRLLTGTEVSPRQVVREKLYRTREEEKTDAKRRVVATLLVVFVGCLVLGSLLANWTSGKAPKPRAAPSRVPATASDERQHPKILTVFASRNPEAIQRFKSPLHDMVRVRRFFHVL